MGVVYEGLDTSLDRRVAIKMITSAYAADLDMLKRFSREAQSLGSLQHPNIVTLFDFGTHEGNPFLVLEYLEGESLDLVMSTPDRLNLLEKITTVIQICRGLSYMHRRGVVHRDLKPGNIMLCNDGAVKIFDFGIARARDLNVTRTGELVGTLKYMAPEQIDSGPIDLRTDIFSAAVVLYQLVTNHLPFEGENTASTIFKIVHEPPTPLATFMKGCPPELEPILHRAMAKKPDDRYSSADDFALELDHLVCRIREDVIKREMRYVSTSLGRGEVWEARSTLQRMLKVDPQNSDVIRLLRAVQQQCSEIEKEVYNLRQSAEGALASKQFATAQEYVDRALVLRRDDSGLLKLREDISADWHAERFLQSLNSLPTEPLASTRITEQIPISALPSGQTPVQHGPDHGTESHHLAPEQLKIVERELAAIIGPLAKVLVKRAVSKTTDIRQLYLALASELEVESDRKAFLARIADLPHGRETVLPVAPQGGASQFPIEVEGPAEEMTPAGIEEAGRLLLPYLGPISLVLAKREAQKASSLRNLYRLLAAHIVEPRERERFLKSASIPDTR
jgi:serine/threonine protein kinase